MTRGRRSRRMSRKREDLLLPGRSSATERGGSSAFLGKGEGEEGRQEGRLRRGQNREEDFEKGRICRRRIIEKRLRNVGELS